METYDESWVVEKTVPLASLPYSIPGTTYILLKLPENGTLNGTFNLTLKFEVKDVDPATGEPESDEHYDDVYAVCLFLFILINFCFCFS